MMRLLRRRTRNQEQYYQTIEESLVEILQDARTCIAEAVRIGYMEDENGRNYLTTLQIRELITELQQLDSILDTMYRE